MCPKLHTIFRVRLPQCRAEQDNPRPAGDALPDATQDTVALLVARTLSTQIQLAIDQDPPGPFPGTAFQHLIPQSVCTSEVASSQVQNSALSLVELHMVGDCPALQFVEVSLQGLPVFEGVNSSSQFCVICNLAQYPFQFFVQVIYEDVEEHRV
ncbi:hypothetical protein BTVI_42998 [Pitangus sulphuratus]|nr:hypothetical protein BTVI_42998 [Pitangus sulphuratus]